MHITMVNAPLLPVPPVLGGPIERTLYETALAIGKPKMTVISPWAKDVVHWAQQVPEHVFYHVDIKQQMRYVRDVLGAHMPNTRHARHFAYLNGVTEVLCDLNPDIIQVHNDVQAMAYLAKQFPNKKKILYMHNEPHYGSNKTVACARVCDHLIFVSQYLKDRFCFHFPFCKDRVHVIYNGVDVNAFTPRLKEHAHTQKVQKKLSLKFGRTLLFVGRTVPVKGVHCLLNAMPLVLDALPDTKLVVAGSPLFGAVSKSAYMRRLKKQTKKMGDAVVFTGFVEPDKLPFYYAAADVSVVPSLWGEPFGKVVVEAMAAGLPVVGSARGAIPELVDDGEMGLLMTTPKDCNVLATHIIRLLQKESVRKKFGSAARKKAVDSFSKDVRIEKMQAFYKHI